MSSTFCIYCSHVLLTFLCFSDFSLALPFISSLHLHILDWHLCSSFSVLLLEELHDQFFYPLAIKTLDWELVYHG